MGSLGDVYSENYATTSNVGDASTEDTTGAKGKVQDIYTDMTVQKKTIKCFKKC